MFNRYHRESIPSPAVLVPMVLAAASELALGRQLWGAPGVPGFWSGNIHSSHNSQFVFDPYTFTHVTHGILFYGLFRVLFKRVSEGTGFLMAAVVESAWEVLENSDLVIERYRAATISLDYYGDSIVNSMSDIVACLAGFFFASRLPARAVVLSVVAVELILLYLVRDNLTLNILMLIRPVSAIRAWQSGI